MKALFHTPLGPILLQATPLGLQSARLLQPTDPLPALSDEASRCPVLCQAMDWLSAYFGHKALPRGRDSFQDRVGVPVDSDGVHRTCQEAD